MTRVGHETAVPSRARMNAHRFASVGQACDSYGQFRVVQSSSWKTPFEPPTAALRLRSNSSCGLCYRRICCRIGSSSNDPRGITNRLHDFGSLKMRRFGWVGWCAMRTQRGGGARGAGGGVPPAALGRVRGPRRHAAALAPAPQHARRRGSGVCLAGSECRD